ncbi:MAG: Na+:solute symporter, partial [Panacibacter sp.]
IWKELPPSHSQLFNDPYTATFVGVIFFLYALSYNGGSWSLATRYISSPNEREATKAAQLSGILYLMFAPLGIAGYIGYRWWQREKLVTQSENP